MRADGSGLRRVTSGGLYESDPAFSPGGGRIVFQRYGGRFHPSRVVVMRSDGSDPHVLARKGAGFPEWAPNGRHIVFVRAADERIWVMRPDGSQEEGVYFDPRSSASFLRHDPHYAPSSRSILFNRYTPASSEPDVMRMRAFGANPHKVNTPVDLLGHRPPPRAAAWLDPHCVSMRTKQRRRISTRRGAVARCGAGSPTIAKDKVPLPRAGSRFPERITPHECRHTIASLMIAAGVNAKALSLITLDRYGHLMPGSEDEGGGRLGRGPAAAVRGPCSCGWRRAPAAVRGPCSCGWRRADWRTGGERNLRTACLCGF
jgi:WD40-like Beta Propeller Repeat